MTPPTARDKHDLYGKVAFGLVVLAVYGEFLRLERVQGQPWQIGLVFTLGAIYATLGVVGLPRVATHAELRTAAYFVVQAGLATAIVLITPLKGFSAIITMPIVSMAVLQLGRGWAATITCGLFLVCVGAIWISFGADAGRQVIMSYGVAFVFTVVFSFVTRQAQEARNRAEQLSNELATANAQLRLYAEQAGEFATVRERNRLAREIHDGLGHYLTTINVQLEAAQAVIATQPARATEALKKAAQLSREALEDIRHSVGTLRADVPRPPLAQALQSLAQNLGLRVTLHLRGAARLLPEAVEHALYRSAQEALTNVLKHAAATHTDLTLDYLAPDRVILTVADNGRGARPGESGTGFGLCGIRERLELLGGHVKTDCAPDRGFVLCLELPAWPHRGDS